MYRDKVVVIVFLVCFIFAAKAQFRGLSIFAGVSRANSMDDDENRFDTRDPCGGVNASCVPLSQCPLLEDLLDLSCFNSDRYFHRLNSLMCGRFNNEDYVCCPTCQCDRLSLEDTCGRSMVKGPNYEGIGSLPWVARIGFTKVDTGNVRFACSGSIISKKYVLTAAHCALAKHDGYQLSTVVVGEWDIGRSPDCNDYFCAPPTQAIKIEKTIIHPGYEAKIFRHDIALLSLVDDIQFTVTAAPVCLSSDADVVMDERAALVGWGQLSGQKNMVSQQQVLEVPLVPLQLCQETFMESVPVEEGHLCAGGEEGKDACSGFGGAPLLVRRGDRYEQVGIVSFGSKNCGDKNVPSVYTNVAHYYKWIVDITLI